MGTGIGVVDRDRVVRTLGIETKYRCRKSIWVRTVSSVKIRFPPDPRTRPLTLVGSNVRLGRTRGGQREVTVEEYSFPVS